MPRTLKAKDIERLENTSVAALAEYSASGITNCGESICVISTGNYLGLLGRLV